MGPLNQQGTKALLLLLGRMASEGAFMPSPEEAARLLDPAGPTTDLLHRIHQVATSTRLQWRDLLDACRTAYTSLVEMDESVEGQDFERAADIRDTLSKDLKKWKLDLPNTVSKVPDIFSGTSERPAKIALISAEHVLSLLEIENGSRNRRSVELLIDPGSASPILLAQLLSALSDLHRAYGGTGLKFSEQEVRSLLAVETGL